MLPQVIIWGICDHRPIQIDCTANAMIVNK